MICREGTCYQSEEDELCEAAVQVDAGRQDGSVVDDDGDPSDADDGEEADAAPDAGPPVAPSEPGQVIVTEIQKDPVQADDEDGEWFEIHNPTDLTFDLADMVVSDESKPVPDRFVLPKDVILGPGEYMVFAPISDSATNGGVPVDIIWDVGEIVFFLGNKGTDEIILTIGSVELDRVVYDETFSSMAGRSASLDPDAHDEAGNDDVDNWCDGQTAYGAGDLGTPGEANPQCPMGTLRAADRLPARSRAVQ
jgi:Lamin Tail Domain